MIPPSVSGNMTRVITNPDDYYYRRLYVDAANAISTARSLPGVNLEMIATSGASQGGALSLAASALDTIRASRENAPVADTIADVPFMSHFERAVGLTGSYPYWEIVEYLSVKQEDADAAFNTLSYFDSVNMARRIKGPGLFSVGLMDPIAPPSTVFAAYNHFAGDAEIIVYTFSGHVGGGPWQTRRETEWLQTLT